MEEYFDQDFLSVFHSIFFFLFGFIGAENILLHVRRLKKEEPSGKEMEEIKREARGKVKEKGRDQISLILPLLLVIYLAKKFFSQICLVSFPLRLHHHHHVSKELVKMIILFIIIFIFLLPFMPLIISRHVSHFRSLMIISPL